MKNSSEQKRILGQISGKLDKKAHLEYEVSKARDASGKDKKDLAASANLKRAKDELQKTEREIQHLKDKL